MPSAAITTAIGIVAAVCTTLSFVPQIIKIRRQGARDLSYGMLALYLLGLSLWLIYGIRIEAPEVIGANIIAGSLVAFALVLKWRSEFESRSDRP
jgi:MtN3 and saliva related transmembrane protein